MLSPAAEVYRVLSDAVRPLELVSPSEFAAAHRWMKPGSAPGSPSLPIRWSNRQPYPYLGPIMDVALEMIREGKTGCVMMKSTQGGGSEAWGINLTLWLAAFFPGPQLYLTAKEDNARKFVRDRWNFAAAKCEPVARKHLTGKRHGEQLLVKHFLDGGIDFSSSGSVLNMISNPYRWVFVDEVDSAADAMPDGSDPIALLLKRMQAFKEAGATGMFAWAHPTTRERGAAYLYYELSDQRRGHVECPHCRTWVAPRWEHVRAIAREGQTEEEAVRTPRAYVFVAPCCGVEWTDSDRRVAIREVRQVSTLPPEVARLRDWIGVHFWAFFQAGAGSVYAMAKEYVAALDDPEKMQVFVQKTLGEPFAEEVAERESFAEAWAAARSVEGERGAHARGEVPEPVQYLTSGQDPGLYAMHWAVWGWGFVEDFAAGVRDARDREPREPPKLAGWLIDWGELPGPKEINPTREGLLSEDFFAFEELLYRRVWGRSRLTVRLGLHDAHYFPDAVNDYCRGRKERLRARPSIGLGRDDLSKAPPIKWKTIERTTADPNGLERADLNTFRLKLDLVRMLEARRKDAGGSTRSRLALPYDVESDMLDHLDSEKLEKDRKGRRSWKKKTHENHYWDCAVMALAAARDLEQTARRRKLASVAAAETAPAPASAQVEREDDDEDARRGAWQIGRDGGD